MKIIFMGTPAFAVPSLDILLSNHYDVVAVITAPDKPAGRGRHLSMSAVKEYALSKHLKVLQPANLKDPNFLKEVGELKAELQIVVAFRMLPEALWKMPPMGTFNLHASLLPRYRGAAPINRAIMNGETETGLTTFFLRQEIDTGNIIYQLKISIGPDETAGELHDRMMKAGAELVLKTVRDVENGSVVTQSQDDFIQPGESLPAAPKIFREDTVMDLQRDVQSLYNHVRGLSPYPGACFKPSGYPSDFFIKVYRCKPVKASGYTSGVLVTDNKSWVHLGAADGYLELLEIQLPGKKKLPVAELLRGYQFPIA